MISFTNWPLYPLGKIPDIQSIGDWVVLGDALDDLGEKKKKILALPGNRKVILWSSSPRPSHFTGYTVAGDSQTVSRGAAGYFQTLFFLLFYVFYYSLQWLLRC